MGAGGGGDTPPQFGNLKLWFEADDTALNSSDAPAGNNDGVKTWTDKSGSGNTLTQGTSSKRPTFQTNVQNGLPAVYFDGIDDVMWKTSPSGVLVSRQTYLYVVKFNSSGDIRYISAAGFTVGVGRGFINRRLSSNVIAATLENIANVATTVDTFNSGSGFVAICVRHGTGVPIYNAKIFLNGGDTTDTGNTNSTFSSTGDFALGADSVDGTYSPFKGWLLRFQMWDIVLEDEDVATLFSQANSKWALYEA